MTKAKLFQLLTLLCFLSLGNQLNAQCEATTIQTTSGATTVYTCPGDSNDDLVDLENSGNGTTNFAYVATDQNNNILGINPTSTFNFEGAGVGTCLVWGFSYTGNITAQEGDFLFSTPFSDGCFQISDNLVRVVRDMPDGATINSNSGSNILTFCTTDIAPDVVNYNNNSTSTSAYEYVITDANNNILGHTSDQSFDFDGVPAGVCRIWGLSYSGSLTLMMGANAATSNLSDDCFDLSDNFIEVSRTDVDGGTVADANGATNLITCAGDGNDDVVTFTHQTNAGATYGYIITDENNLVLGVPPGNSQNFEGAGEGVCRVWGISYTGSLTVFGGDNILNKTLSDDCFDLSDNFIEVVRTGVDGGDVYTADGESMIYTCPGDGIDDVIEFMHTNNSAANFTYVVTDQDGNILGVPPGNTQNFEGAGSGTCLVWGLSYTGTLTAMAGDNALTTALSDGCFGLSSNFVTVVRDMADGGTVSTVGGATTAYTCPGNGIADVIEFAHVSNSAANYAYVVTDDNNNILGIPPGNAQNFEGAPAGTCRVWGLSYTGTILAGAGDNAATTTLTDGCFSLSSNFVTIVREQPQAGTLDAGGATTVYTCPGDGNDDVIDFTANGFNQNFQLVITDDNYNILGLPGGTSQNFEGAGVGTCLAWGVSYTGDIVAGAGDNIFSSVFSSDCWEFSEPVRVVRDVAEGGTIQNNSGSNEVTVCTTDGNPNVISYNHTTTSSSAYTYLITDDNNNILGIHPAQDFDFEGVPAGVCRIWGLSYSGTLLAAMGQNAATETLADGCFDLSDNFIEVTRTDVHGGTVAMPSGATERYTCTQDGNADVVMFTHDNNSTSSYSYIITDSDNNVLGLPPGNSADFDGAPPGTCRVWGISYTGDLTLFGGDNIMNKSLSTDCYDLSDNYIAIIRDTPNGGTVETVDGETSVTVTVGDGIDDEIFFQHAGNSNSNFTYVVTDDNNIILGIPPGNSQNFEGAPAGTCRVWGLSYTGTITAQVGDDAGTVALTDDCFDLSDNFVEIIRLDDTNCQAEGGTLTGGPFAFTVGDGTPDMIATGSITLENSQGQESQWVVTDDEGYILGLPPMPSAVNFDGAGAGTCLIWHISFDTGLQGLAMGNNALTDLVGCFDISNSVEVVRTNSGNCQANGGELLGGPFAFTVGDGTPDMIAGGSITLANSQGEESQWVVTDDEGYILGLPPMPSAVNFDGAGAGTCLIWHISFDTGLQGLAMGNNALTDLVGCFDISNSIEVVRTNAGACQANGGELLGGPFAFTVGDGTPDMIAAGSITLANSQGQESQWVVTDDEGYILGLPPMPSAVNFDGAGAGTCLIWHISFDTGLQGLAMGNNALTDLVGCFDISNSIEVVRTNAGACQANGGALIGGPFAFTVGDGTPDMIAAGSITLANSQGQESQWVVTDDEGYILGLPPMPSAVNFDGAGAGTCLIWHISFDTGLQGLAMGNNALTDLVGCFDISNSIEVVRTNAGACQANGGALIGGPFAFTVGDGVPDMIAAGSITLANSQGEESQWVVTDDQGLILGLPPMPSAVNFDGAGAGTCLIWHISYDTGLQGLAMGNNALTDLVGCYNLSNSIEVVRTSQGTLTGGIVINEINGNDRFEIKNTGTTAVDISSYWICDFPNYSQISSLVSECNTDLILDPDEVITLVSDFDISENDGEFGLYINTSWSDPNSIMDYVEWGSSGHTRSTVAIAAGIWTADDFVPAFSGPMSIHYDGQGDSSTDWSEAAFSSCQGLIQDENELGLNIGLSQASIQDLTAYPNPTNGMVMMTLDYMEDNEVEAQVNVMSAQGQIVQSNTMNLTKGKNQLEISLSNLPGGIYFLDINADNIRETMRVIKQ